MDNFDLINVCTLTIFFSKLWYCVIIVNVVQIILTVAKYFFIL